MNIDPRTKDYVAKRTEEGKSKREIMRCLRRYVAREVYRQITHRSRHHRSRIYVRFATGSV